MSDHDPNSNASRCCDKTRTAITVFVIVGTLLILGGLVELTIAYTQPPSTTAARAAERVKFREDYQKEVAIATNGYARIDVAKGVVRLPIARAMELSLQEWQNPAAARSNLIDRVEKATFVPPPPPAKPSQYE